MKLFSEKIPIQAYKSVKLLKNICIIGVLC